MSNFLWVWACSCVCYFKSLQKFFLDKHWSLGGWGGKDKKKLPKNTQLVSKWTEIRFNIKIPTLRPWALKSAHSVVSDTLGPHQLYPARLFCPWSQTQLSDFTLTFHFHALEKEMATHSSVLAWRTPGMEKPGGLPSMGSHRVGHDWSNLAAAEPVD